MSAAGLLPALVVRLPALRALDADPAWDAAPRQALERHAELPFFSLLDEGEVERLARLFPDELRLHPEAPAADRDDRAGWDLRARAYLGRFLAFADAVADLGLRPRDPVPSTEPGSLLAVTANGSLLWLGPCQAPRVRPYVYASLRADQPVRRGAGPLFHDPRLGRRLWCADVMLSDVRGLAVDPFGVSQDLVEAAAPHRPAVSWVAPRPLAAGDRSAWLEYEAARTRLSSGGPAVAADPVLGADLLGLARVLQEAAAGPSAGRRLGEVRGWETEAGTVYRVEPGAAGHRVVREHRGQATARVEPATIDPQRLVPGAPVVVIDQGAADGAGAVAFCTEPVRAVWPRTGLARVA